MPIYGYVCEACNHDFEIMHGLSDPPPEQCKECGGALRRRFYPVATIFKGGGFYHTDYGKGKEFKKIEEKECKQDSPVEKGDSNSKITDKKKNVED